MTSVDFNDPISRDADKLITIYDHESEMTMDILLRTLLIGLKQPYK